MHLSNLINRYVPMAFLPKRYNFSQQVRMAFRHSAGRTLEQAFELCNVDAKQISVVLSSMYEKYGDVHFLNHEKNATQTLAVVIAEITQYLVTNMHN